jgi:hypothetical protein
VGPPDGTPAGPEPRAEPEPDAALSEDERDVERFLAERPPHHDQER